MNKPINRILGAAKLGSISQKESYKLLTMLAEKEIYMIDTAPSYPKSELRIGEFMKLNNNCQIKVMTKFGRETHPVTKQTLRESVHKSFERLRVDHIYGLTVHNRSENDIRDEVFDEILKLKAYGQISKFGWCGEWRNLPTNSLYNYDFVMLPVNPYVPNIKFLVDQIDVPLIAMNPFANFFWNYKEWNLVKKIINEKIFKKYNPRPNQYFTSKVNSPKSLNELIGFILKNGKIGSICFGSTRPDHVDEIIDVIYQFYGVNRDPK